MELKEFISETITQIVLGIEDAFTKIDNKDVIINPYSGEDGRIKSLAGNERNVQQIEMSIMLQVDSSKEKGTGFGVKVFEALEYNNKGKQDSSQSQVSSVKFSIPISLPSLYPTKNG